MKDTKGWELSIERDDGNVEIVRNLVVELKKKILGTQDCPDGARKDQIKTNIIEMQNMDRKNEEYTFTIVHGVDGI